MVCVCVCVGWGGGGGWVECPIQGQLEAYAWPVSCATCETVLSCAQYLLQGERFHHHKHGARPCVSNGVKDIFGSCMDFAFGLTIPELVELWKAVEGDIGVVGLRFWIGSAVCSNQGISMCVGFLAAFEVFIA